MLEVGEYVRIKPWGTEKIEKVERLDKTEDDEDIIITDKDSYFLRFLENYLINHSKNIIDLIEVRRCIKCRKL